MTLPKSIQLTMRAAALLWLAGCTSNASDVDGQNASITATCSMPDAPVLEARTPSLWPPNHKLHEIAVQDCVSATDACGNTLQGEFIWASSDEPIDDIGDGHHAPDIALSSDNHTVCVRSERQGPKDGRVYKLGVRVRDANGNASEAECQIVVDHDKRGVVGADSGEAYRVMFDGTQSKDCGPVPPAPPVNPPVTPPQGMKPPSNPPGMQPPSNPPDMQPPSNPPADPPMQPPMQPPATPIPDSPT